MIKRIVEVFEHKLIQERDDLGIVLKSKLERKSLGRAVFRQWGIDYEELEQGIGNFSTAIVEFNDGTVLNVPVYLIRFENR